MLAGFYHKSPSKVEDNGRFVVGAKTCKYLDIAYS
jgi:hypothetical protein